LVVVREVAQEQQRQHLAAEVAGVHRAAQVVSDGVAHLAKSSSVRLQPCYLRAKSLDTGKMIGVNQRQMPILNCP